MMTTSNDTEIFYGQIPAGGRPEPGSWIQVELSNGLVAQVWNLGDDRKLEEMASHSLHYVPVRTASVKQHVVHAAVNRRLYGRNKVNETTICSRMGDDRRIVSSILPGSLDETVTCEQCRKQLRGDGVIP